MQHKMLGAAAAAFVLGIGVGSMRDAGGETPTLTLPQGGGNSARQQQSVGDFPDLVGGLKATPGCIDVKTSAFNNGKTLTIFAWFENKAAVNAWYKSPMHQGAMKKFFPTMPGAHEALAGYKDEKSPLLVVASVTPSDKPAVQGSQLAISQIAIEIYTPVPGGVTFGGGFGPDSLKVPGLRRMKMD